MKLLDSRRKEINHLKKIKCNWPICPGGNAGPNELASSSSPPCLVVGGDSRAFNSFDMPWLSAVFEVPGSPGSSESSDSIGCSCLLPSADTSIGWLHLEPADLDLWPSSSTFDLWLLPSLTLVCMDIWAVVEMTLGSSGGLAAEVPMPVN